MYVKRDISDNIFICLGWGAVIISSLCAGSCSYSAWTNQNIIKNHAERKELSALKEEAKKIKEIQKSNNFELLNGDTVEINGVRYIYEKTR